MSKKQKPAKKEKSHKKQNTPKQKRLPGMEDAKIEELQDGAEDYASIRDRRMALTEQEVDSKAELLALMKKHEKQTYRYNGVEIKVVHEDETVRVKIHKDEP